MELIFDVRDAEEGGFFFFADGDTWKELRANILEAVSLHFEGRAEPPRLVRLLLPS